MSKTQTLTKSELANLLNVSPDTVRKYLNQRYYEQLKAIGYDKNQKILLPCQVKLLITILDFDIPDTKATKL